MTGRLSCQSLCGRMTATGCALLMLFHGQVLAADWDNCSYELDRLRRAAANASDAATTAGSKEDDLEDCRNFPDIYDFFRDGCRTRVNDYRSALSTLNGELSALDSRIRSVASSCGGSTVPQRPSSGNRFCDLYRSYAGTLPRETILKVCTQDMPEADCRTCLEQ